MLKDILPKIKDAYSLLLMPQKSLCANREQYGFSPLVIGRLKKVILLLQKLVL